MSSAPPEKHPKKKRRLENNDSQPGPSNAAQALTAPQLVRRSSRDPNRGMYPRTRARSNQESSCPQFETASTIYKRTSHRQKHSKTEQKGANPPVKLPAKTDSTASSSNEENCLEAASKNNYASVRAKSARRSKFAQTDKCKKITKIFRYSSYRKGKDFDLSAMVSPKEWSERDEELVKYLDCNKRFYDTFNQCYGLVETAPTENPDFISYLPNHIIEYIICLIPWNDMMSCREVCHHFKNIIDDESFMKWKKLYYRYKIESSTSNTIVQEQICTIVRSFGHNGVETCIETIVRYLAEGFHQRPSSDMHTLLMKTCKGRLADEVMSERYPELETKESRVWCQLAIAIIISESVWEILGMYCSLFNSKSESTRPAVLDAMYCIATFLLYFRNVDNTNHAFHYRLYYVLNMLDNYIPLQHREKVKIVKGLPGQQSIHCYSSNDNSFSHLTVEQIRILNHPFEINQRIRIIALAGSGKTTTLRNLSKLYPQIKFLNIVFNRALSDEAKKSFPPNVTCQTAHSLAYASVGRYLKNKLVTKIRAYDIGAENVKHNTGGCPYFSYANLLLVTLNNFVTSMALQISSYHVPLRDSCDKRIEDSTRGGLLKDVRELWEKMIDKDDPTKITHDVYLKLYQLRRPNFKKYQCILVDEAQDCNPAMLDIILSQPVPVVVVGDPHQQIYAFRGAVNGLSKLTYTHTYYLTKSFRFGPEISYIASNLLECYKPSSRDFSLVGNEKETFIDGRRCGQYAVIARTNVKLFNEAVRMVVNQDLKPHEPVVLFAAFIGGIKNYGFEQMVDIYKLRSGMEDKFSRIKDRFIAKFRDFKELSKYATQADDTDLLTKIDLVNQHGGNILHLVSVLTEKCNHPLELANVVFTTAHKAKGLEFDTVSLTDDFPFNVDHVEHRLSSVDDFNVMYVALTRAKKSLILPEKLMKILTIAREKFEIPVSSKKVLGNEKTIKCCVCQTDFTPHTVLLLQKQRMTVASGREIVGGPLCIKCGTDPLMRPEVHGNNVVMLLDVIRDNCHEFLKRITGPLPGEPQIKYQNYNYGDEAEIFVINIHN